MSVNSLQKAVDLLRPNPNWPKPGITFFDLNPVLGSPAAMDAIITAFAERWSAVDIDMIAGFDARGFIFGPLLCKALGGVPFTMIRKKGKLPPPTYEESYGLEYGNDVVEVTADGSIKNKKVLLIDDLLATGGTASAGMELIERAGGTVVGFTCLTELPELHGRLKLADVPVFSLISVLNNEKLLDVAYCVDLFACDEASGALVLLNRLGEVPGVVMPGGQIDERESALDAALRELMEETGLEVTTIKAVTALADTERDPRGPKVSIVFEVAVKPGLLKPETGKTDPFWIKSGQSLPEIDAFAFDHGAFVHNRWQQVA